MRYAPELAESFAQELSEEDVVFAEGLAKLPSVNSDMLRTILEAYATMTYAALPHLPLELAIIDSTQRKGI